jgi:hypothetical protein
MCMVDRMRNQVSAACQAPTSRSLSLRSCQNEHLLVVRRMQTRPVMHRLVVVVAVAGCTESTEERLDRLKAEADIVCWEYSGCAGGSGAQYPPFVPIEQGVSCMNDALASGTRAGPPTWVAGSWKVVRRARRQAVSRPSPRTDRRTNEAPAQ